MSQTGSAHLGPDDLTTLGDRLGSEADMAYRRRMRRLMGYLELEERLRILDCGCGIGSALVLLDALRSVRLVGLDVETGRLAKGREAGVPGGLVQADLCLAPFPDAVFDRVLLAEVLEHVADERAALAELFRVLRPGGILALSVPHADFPFFWDPINKIWGALGGRPIRRGPLVGIWTGHERLYRPRELVARMRAAGFVAEVVEEATHYAFPFSHLLLYGLGRPLVERRLLPRGLRRRLDRLSPPPDSRPRFDLARTVLAPMRAVDRLNDRPGTDRRKTFVNVLVKARKPH